MSPFYARDVSFRFLLQPKWLAWTAVVVVAVVVMANLSAWQLSRLADRRATNAAIAERADEPVVSVDDPSLEGLSDEDLRYRRVTAVGTYLGESEVAIANQTMGGAPGWWLVTPLRTNGGSVVLVNRGWVPFALLDPAGSFEQFAPPTGEVGISGILQSGQSPVAGVEPGARSLPRLDVAAASVALGLPVADVWLQLEDQQPAQASGEPLMLSMRALDDGPHMNYAGQWAIFATLTAVVFAALVIRTAQGGGGGPQRRSGGGTTPRRRGSEPKLLVHLGVRLAPLTGPDRLAEVTGLPQAEVDERLFELVEQGYAMHHDPSGHAVGPSGWTLTSAGWEALEGALAAELDAAGVRTDLTEAYGRFVELNGEVLEVCTDWQVRRSGDGNAPVLNDHSDPGYDEAVVDRLGRLDDLAGPLCDDLGAALGRFGAYRNRLGDARRRVESGDTGWIDRPLVDSYHTVWFELHENLLATLGLRRGDGTVTAGARTGVQSQPD